MGWHFNDDEIPDSGGVPNPGYYLAEVRNAERRRSRSGDEMVNLEFLNAETGEFLCYDFVMLAGKGLGIGLKKLEALGVATHGASGWDVEDLEMWLRKRCVLKLEHEKYTTKEGEERTAARPAFRAENFGYMTEQSWDEVRPASGSAPIDDDDIPF